MKNQKIQQMGNKYFEQHDNEPHEILTRAGLNERDFPMRYLETLGEVFTFYFAHSPNVYGHRKDGKIQAMQDEYSRLASLVMESHAYFEEGRRFEENQK